MKKLIVIIGLLLLGACSGDVVEPIEPTQEIEFDSDPSCLCVPDDAEGSEFGDD